MAYISAIARQFAGSRETSDEIAQAILTLDTDRGADDIWSDPSPAEFDRVVSAAWELAGADEDVLHWGQMTVRRGAAI